MFRVAASFCLLVGFALADPIVFGSAFLKLGVGARPVGMGGAFTAVAEGADGLFWNPAGLALTRSYDANVTFMQAFDAVSYTSGGITAPVSRGLGLGLAVAHLGASDTRRGPGGEETGTFGVHDFAIGPAIGWQPVRGLGIGFVARYLGSDVDSFRAYSASFDAGVLYRFFDILAVGASVLHFGPPRRFLSGYEYQPTDFRAGVALNIPLSGSRLLLASDVSTFLDLDPTYAFGIEMFTPALGTDTLSQGLSMRFGYQTGSDLDAGTGWSVGAGYEYRPVSFFRVGVDIVYLGYGMLGTSERATIYLRFGP